MSVQTIQLLHRLFQQAKGDWFSAVDLADAFFSILVARESQQQCAFMWKGCQCTFTSRIFELFCVLSQFTELGLVSYNYTYNILVHYHKDDMIYLKLESSSKQLLL